MVDVDNLDMACCKFCDIFYVQLYLLKLTNPLHCIGESHIFKLTEGILGVPCGETIDLLPLPSIVTFQKYKLLGPPEHPLTYSIKVTQ